MSVEIGAYARLADELFAAESARDEARADAERLREALEDLNARVTAYVVVPSVGSGWDVLESQAWARAALSTPDTPTNEEKN